MSIILKDGPISKFKILELNADPDDFSSHKSSKLFSDQLLWLIRNYPPEPLLSRNVLEEVAEAQLVPFFDDLVLRIQEAFSVPSFADLPLDFHCMIFNECVGIFNDLIECVKSTLTDSDLQSFAYPAKEFADLNVSNDLGLQWNSDEEFDRIRELVTACYLPFISELSLEGSRYGDCVIEPGSLVNTFTKRISVTFKICITNTQVVSIFHNSVNAKSRSSLKKSRFSLAPQTWLRRIYPIF